MIIYPTVEILWFFKKYESKVIINIYYYYDIEGGTKMWKIKLLKRLISAWY